MSGRLRRIAVSGVVLALTTAGLTLAGRAGAVTQSGQLLAKVQGSAYSPEPSLFSGLTAKKPALFSLAIKNTGDVQTQYRVEQSVYSGSWTVTVGKSVITTAPYYYTAPVAPGAITTLTVQATQPGEDFIDVRIADNHDEVGTWFMSATSQAQPTFSGTGTADLFLKTGSLPWIPGVLAQQGENSAALAPGKSAKFSLRIQNNGSAPSTDALVWVTGTAGCTASDFVVTIKDGSHDVTQSVVAGTYTPNLTPGKHLVLTVQVSYPAAVAGCQAWFGQVLKSGTYGSQVMVAPVAA